MILREDMLELTRRMTLKRNCFARIAGAYIRDGEVDETFNINFRRLSVEEQQDKLAIAREIPFAPTNQNLKDYRFLPKAQGSGSMWQFLMALNKCQLKNDALLDVIYEEILKRYPSEENYAILFFQGVYDIPRKGSDKESQWESEEMYPFIIGAICPLYGEYEPGLPETGFLFPAYRMRCGDMDRINFYNYEENDPPRELLALFGIVSVD